MKKILVLFSLVFAVSCTQSQQKMTPLASALKPEMVKVKGGSFVFADDRIPIPSKGILVPKDVLVHSFYFSKYTVRVELWNEFLKDTGYKGWSWQVDFNPKTKLEDQNKSPVGFVTWYEAVYFCNWLSQKMGLDPAYKIKGTINRDEKNFPKVTWDKRKNGFRLPTPEEWQFAIYQRMENPEVVVKAIKKEWEAGNKDDGLRDSRGKPKYIIFSTETDYRNSLGVFLNIYQYHLEHTWGFFYDGNGHYSRYYEKQNDPIREIKPEEKDIVALLLFSDLTVQPVEFAKAYDYYTIRLARNAE